MTIEEAQLILDQIPGIVAYGGGVHERRWLRKGSKIKDHVPDRVYCENGDVYHIQNKWIGAVPKHCDIVPDRTITDSFIDGRIMGHGWANMHPDTHAAIGCGLGTGKGQLYKKVGEDFYKCTRS